jgi:tight adherence protein B
VRRRPTPLIAAAALYAVLALVVSAAAIAATAPNHDLRLTATRGARFPDRAFVLTLPSEKQVSVGQVHVTENGKPVVGPAIIPAGQSRAGSFAVVFVIDASNSMAGEPIAGAMRAARTFVTHRNPNQAVAVVTFNREPYVRLPFTTDTARINGALAATPPLDRGTHVYDAVDKAVALLADAKVTAGSVVLLSDGADTGSRTTLTDASATAAKRNVRIFSVGLRSHAYSPAPLEQLASGAGGSYSEARRASDLAPIYDALGTQLASEYLVRYRSTAGPRQHVVVDVSVDGTRGKATASYDTPALPKIPLPPFHLPLAVRFLQSAASMIVISLACGSLLALGLAAMIRPRKRQLRGRMAEFVSVTSPAGEQKGGALARRLPGGAERSFERTSWWPRFNEELQIAGVQMPAIQVVAWTLIATVIAAWILLLIGGSGIFAVFALGVPLTVRGAVKRRLQRQRRLFAEQLPDNLQILASALRAGHSLVGALSVVVEDSPEPSRSELGRVIADEQLGVPLEEALGVVVRRMESRDVAQIALVARLQRETGGNTAEVLDRVAENVRERVELRGQVKTLTAQGRMSRWVMSFLPIGLLVLLTLINRDYMAPLFTRTAGRILLALAALLIISGSLVIKRIVDIKV